MATLDNIVSFVIVSRYAGSSASFTLSEYVILYDTKHFGHHEMTNDLRFLRVNHNRGFDIIRLLSDVDHLQCHHSPSINLWYYAKISPKYNTIILLDVAFDEVDDGSKSFSI